MFATLTWRGAFFYYKSEFLAATWPAFPHTFPLGIRLGCLVSLKNSLFHYEKESFSRSPL